MTILQDELYMHRCLHLARLGKGKVAPNPLVGSVVVHKGRIIGEGWHQIYGGAHAEVNALSNVPLALKKYLPNSCLYVNLEPCAHYGKTPPCSDLIIRHKLQRVVIGCVDPFVEVSGQGIAKLKAAGIGVQTGVLETESHRLNRRFMLYQQLQRPYIILKYAQTANNFFAPIAGQKWITGSLAKSLNHRWRSEESAIVVGSRTASIDNPKLTVRLWSGKQPLRIVVDRSGRLQANLHLFNDGKATVVFTHVEEPLGYITAANAAVVTQYSVAQNDNMPQAICSYLYSKGIQSVIVEGGAQLLQTFIDAQLWDEARVFTAPSINWATGLPAPTLGHAILQHQYKVGNDLLKIYTPTATKRT